MKNFNYKKTVIIGIKLLFTMLLDKLAYVSFMNSYWYGKGPLGSTLYYMHFNSPALVIAVVETIIFAVGLFTICFTVKKINN